MSEKQKPLTRFTNNPRPVNSQCNYCAKKQQYPQAGCEIYPDGIPSEIRDQSFVHAADYPGNYCSAFEQGVRYPYGYVKPEEAPMTKARTFNQIFHDK